MRSIPMFRHSDCRNHKTLAIYGPEMMIKNLNIPGLHFHLSLIFCLSLFLLSLTHILFHTHSLSHFSILRLTHSLSHFSILRLSRTRLLFQRSMTINRVMVPPCMTAERAYKNILETGRNQCIVIRFLRTSAPQLHPSPRLIPHVFISGESVRAKRKAQIVVSYMMEMCRRVLKPK